MSFDSASFAARRPFLFHLTARSNVARIRAARRLHSMVELARRAGRGDLLDVRRRAHVRLNIQGEVVHIRDQAPLHENNMCLEDGWTFPQFVRHLNERVFFWPGGASGPIAYGLRHFGRYERERPVLLRIPTDDLFAANRGVRPLYCRYNSGSPRWSRGIASPRGPATFVSSTQATFSPASVVEVAFVRGAALPSGTEVGNSPSGPWRALF
jgi:hypothetical protein